MEKHLRDFFSCHFNVGVLVIVVSYFLVKKTKAVGKKILESSVENTLY